MISSETRQSSPLRRQFLKVCFCCWVLALAVYQFSENTADPDLWAHTMFGEQWLASGRLEKTEPYSWTARGAPWVNHEVLAEAALGGAHRLAGGTGILLLKGLVGLLTLLIALRLGGEDLSWPQRAVAWGVAAVAGMEISFGFAARPQIFTALALALELWLLRRIHREKYWWALALPLLFALWINTHGGVLAGVVVLVAAGGATTAGFLWARLKPGAVSSHSRRFASIRGFLRVRTVLVLWLSTAAAMLALLVNPWGFGLVRWLIGSVLWLRPEIEEWNPTHLGWDHAALFALIAAAAFSFAFSRRPRVLWEIAVCALLAVLALRSVRHTPLFAIAALAFVPPHLADALERYRAVFSRLEALFMRPATQVALAALLGVTSIGMLGATLTLHKQHPLTMEVPKNQYPVAAVEFMRQNELRGNLLVFFDWGEMCLWELPDCPVSVDGRLDTCYPRQLIAEHWNFYNDRPVDPAILDLNRADLALLPVNLAGGLALAKKMGWQAAYFDDLAVVLVREPGRFRKLQPSLPVRGDAGAAAGRVPFPAKPSARVRSPALR
jgi:hypothetical protein